MFQPRFSLPIVKAITFRLITVGVVIGAVLVGDYLLGLFQNTAQVREHSRLFREEVAFLRLSTRNLVPKIDHSYVGITRPEGDRLLPASTARSLRTDDWGAIVGGRGSGARTILFLGGSTTECNEVDEPFRFPAVVEQLLIEAGASVGSMNGGVRGHTTQDSINALLNRPGFREADIVVLMHNINDRLRLSLGGGYTARIGSEAPTSTAAVRGAFYGFLLAFWDWASYRSNIVFALRMAGSQLNPFTGDEGAIIVNERSIDFEDRQLIEHVAEFQQNLKIFVHVVRILGKIPVLMTQPLGIESYEQDQFNEAVRTVAKALDVRLIDLARRLGPDRNWAFLSDNIHLSNSGSAVVGGLVAAELAPIVSVVKPVSSRFERLRPVNPSVLLQRCRPPSGDAPAAGPAYLLAGRSGRYPSFSPDGHYMLFQAVSGIHERLIVFDTIRERYIELTTAESQARERHPAFLDFTNDGFRVVFGSSEGQGTFETLKVRAWPARTTEPLPLGDLGGAIPATASDAVIFPGYRPSGRDSTPNLYRFDRKTGRLSRLLQASEEQWRPAVAPDGTVYFIAGRAGQFDIYRLKPASSKPELFVGTRADEWDPAVSPDGQWLAYASRKDGTWDVYMTRTDLGTSAIKMTSWSGDEWDPSFDPTGKILAFAGTAGAAPFIFGMCLFGENPGGS